MIVLGTYEGNIVGWRQVPSEHRTLIMSFAFNAHSGCVKTCAIDKSKMATLITAGVDEQVRVYNLNSQREVGVLMEHTATITCSDFWGKANAITGDATGTLCIWRCADWLNLHSCEAHSGEVTGVAIHDTGRMAVSVGADKTLQLWDLSKGNQMVKLDLPEVPQGVMWAPGCKQFAVTLASSVQVHSGATGDVVATLPHSSKPTCAVYTDTAVLVTGCSDGSLRVWNTEAGALLRVLTTGHTRRIKSIDWMRSDVFDKNEPAADGTAESIAAKRDLAVGNSDLTGSALELAKRKHKEINSGVAVAPDSGRGILVTVCSAGVVKLWDLGALVQGADDTSALVAAAADDTSALGWRMQETSWGHSVTELVQATEEAPLATLWGAQGSRVTCTAAGRVVHTATAASMTDVAREAVAAVGGVLPPSVKKVKAPKKIVKGGADGTKGVKGGSVQQRKPPKATVRMSIKKARAAAVAAAPAPAQRQVAGQKRPRASDGQSGQGGASAAAAAAAPTHSAPKRPATGTGAEQRPALHKAKQQQQQPQQQKPKQKPKQKGKFARPVRPAPGASQAAARTQAQAQPTKPAAAKKPANTSAAGGSGGGGGGGVVSFLSAKEGRSLMRASRKKQKNRAKRAERQADRLGTE